MNAQNSYNLISKLQDYDNKEQYDEILLIITDEFLEEEKDKSYILDLYIWRGTALYNTKKYDKAILDYDKAISINTTSALSYFNRGFARIALRKYEDAIDDFNKAFTLNPKDYIRANLFIAVINRIMGNTKDAIDNYDRAISINSDYADAYYYRGLCYKENNIRLKESKEDFEKYLVLRSGSIDIWAKYATYHIKELQDRLIDKELDDIANYIFEIKSELKIKSESITHYSSLTVAKSLFIDKTKFRLSEGNFMNDPSEGTELLKFLNCKFSSTDSNNEFFPKPFIGSFVKDDNNLNMWRFYGKEAGTEAMGCSITIKMDEFIYDIQNSLTQKEENISDINFYRVVYINKEYSRIIIPNLPEIQVDKIFDTLKKLKDKICSYQGSNNISIEKYLTTITFLFKSDDYKNEDEVRLVVQGVEFEKKYNKNVTPPKVYIELETIDKIVEKITLGPKVDKASEWASALHYCFEENAPKIVLSHLPYK